MRVGLRPRQCAAGAKQGVLRGQITAGRCVGRGARHQGDGCQPGPWYATCAIYYVAVLVTRSQKADYVLKRFSL